MGGQQMNKLFLILLLTITIFVIGCENFKPFVYELGEDDPAGPTKIDPENNVDEEKKESILDDIESVIVIDGTNNKDELVPVTDVVEYTDQYDVKISETIEYDSCPTLNLDPLPGAIELIPGVQCQVNCHCWINEIYPYSCYRDTPSISVCDQKSNRCIKHPVPPNFPLDVDMLGGDDIVPAQPDEKASCLSRCVINDGIADCIPSGLTTLWDNYYSSQLVECSELECNFVG